MNTFAALASTYALQCFIFLNYWQSPFTKTNAITYSGTQGISGSITNSIY
jgi:hypothetical protein